MRAEKNQRGIVVLATALAVDYVMSGEAFYDAVSGVCKKGIGFIDRHPRIKDNALGKKARNGLVAGLLINEIERGLSRILDSDWRAWRTMPTETAEVMDSKRATEYSPDEQRKRYGN